MTRSPRVAAYCRVSTLDQHADIQVEGIRRAARERGWRLVAEHVDHGVSGGRDRRPALDALLEQVERHEVDVVVVARLDRLGRSLAHVLKLLDVFSKNNVQFVSLADAGLDGTTAVGRMTLQLCAVFAEFETSLLRDRTVAGLAAARARGAVVGRPRRDAERVQRHQIDHGAEPRPAGRAAVEGVPDTFTTEDTEGQWSGDTGRLACAPPSLRVLRALHGESPRAVFVRCSPRGCAGDPAARVPPAGGRSGPGRQRGGVAGEPLPPGEGRGGAGGGVGKPAQRAGTFGERGDGTLGDANSTGRRRVSPGPGLTA